MELNVSNSFLNYLFLFFVIEQIGFPYYSLLMKLSNNQGILTDDEISHDGGMIWKYFPHYCPFLR